MSGTPSPLSSPSTSPRRSTVALRPMRPIRTRTHPRLTAKLSLDRIAEEFDGNHYVLESLPSTACSSGLSTPAIDRVRLSFHEPDNAKYAGTPPRRNKIENRKDGWNGKRGIRVGNELKESCGICFETAVLPNKARCCGQLFCFQHLSDWLSAQGSDGRCPTCRVPLSIETDTVNLHPPTKPVQPRPQPTRARSRSRSPRRTTRSTPPSSSYSSASSSSWEEHSPRSSSPDRESSGSSTTSYDVDSSDTSSDNDPEEQLPIISDKNIDTQFNRLRLDTTNLPAMQFASLSPTSPQRQLAVLTQAGMQYESFLWGDLGRVFTLLGAVIIFCALIPAVVYD